MSMQSINPEMEPTAAPASHEPLIEARNVTLRIPVVTPRDRSIMTNPMRLLSDLYFARTQRGIATLLDNISFALQPGERLGVIGPNGAGKSTLLRLLAGIYQPTQGKLLVNGTARGLFDISLGMHSEATGLENIYMRGLQMGIELKQIRELVPEVLEFSGLDEALEKPLSTYSSGMRLRLAIAVSTMIKPDILLLDEWIGAGDTDFREKVKSRMMSLVETSRGLVLATHSSRLMRDLCTKGLLLDKGRIVFYGSIDDALDHHLK
jgi:ABC-type polysaccharide/polyol phosphate transport system ATPase subunit